MFGLIFYFFWVIFRSKLEAFLGHSMENGIIDDGVIAQDMSQTFSFWRMREV